MSHGFLELLSPAGCYPSLHATIAEGADAVYFGLAQLNMRARARRSFQRQDLPEIVRICRSGGVRCYLALNTLLYEHDLKVCRQSLESVAGEGVDAVILADMAAVQMAHALELEIHLSTQLSISMRDLPVCLPPRAKICFTAPKRTLPMSCRLSGPRRNVRSISSGLVRRYHDFLLS